MKQILSLIFLGVVPLLSAASLNGVVKYKGVPPVLKKIKMSADPECLKLNKSDVMPDKLTINKNKTIRYAFAYIKDGLQKSSYLTPKEPAVLDQSSCMFSPHVLGVQVGQIIKIKNADTTFHNIHSMPQVNPQFNVGLANKDQFADKIYHKPEMGIKVGCDVHPWMRSWLHVMTHPYFGTSDEKGVFTIKDLPVGKYTLAVWHEELGAKEVKVEVTDATKDVEVNIEMGAK